MANFKGIQFYLLINLRIPCISVEHVNISEKSVSEWQYKS